MVVIEITKANSTSYIGEVDHRGIFTLTKNLQRAYVFMEAGDNEQNTGLPWPSEENELGEILQLISPNQPIKIKVNNCPICDAVHIAFQPCTECGVPT